MTFSSSAEKGRFVERRIPDSEVQKILQRGADVVASIDAVRRQDIQNRQAYLNATQENAKVESNNRQQNFDSEAQNRQRNIEQQRRNAEQTARNAQVQGDQTEKIFSSLAGFSQTAGKLYQQYEEKKLKAEWDDEQIRAYTDGLPPDKQIASVNDRYMSQMAGAAADTQADVAQALGTNAFAVESLRGLNKNRKQARLYAYATMAGEKWYGFAMEQFASNKTDTYKVTNEKGESVEINPSQATSYDQQEQVLRQMVPQYLTKYGLSGLSSEFLADSIQNIRRGSNLILGETRKGEIKASQESRESMAKDTLFDLRTPQAWHESYESLRHGKGDKDTRDELLKLTFLARNENGDFQFSDIEIDAILGSSFLHQPGKSIRDMYSNEIQPLFAMRNQSANERFQTDKAKEAMENDKWTEDTRTFINKNAEKLGDKDYDKLIETAKRSSNNQGAAMIADLKSFSTEAKNDKFYEEAWAERINQGLPISRQEVVAARISDKMETTYLRIASQSEANAVPKATMESAKVFIVQSLRQRSAVAIGGQADPTFSRAQAYAESQYRRDFMQQMQRTNDPSDADKYALGRFKEIFSQDKGKYSTDPTYKSAGGQTLYQPAFTNFRVNPTAPRYAATDKINSILKKDSTAIDTTELIPRAQLQRASDEASRNQVVTIPPLAQYIADQTGGQLSVLDVINRQAKALKIPQIPLQSFERVQGLINPEFQRLVNYRPSAARTDRAMISSGQPAVYQKDRPIDSVVGLLVQRGLKRQDAITMAAVMMAESTGNPGVVNNKPNRGALAYGLFQINMYGTLGPDRMKRYGLKSYDDLKDPVKNTDIAVRMFKNEGYGPWEAYTNGMHTKFMGQATAAYERLASQNAGGNPWRSPGQINPDVIQYVTGDQTYGTKTNQFYYADDHGGDKYHDHMAFRSKAALEKAKADLIRQGYRISSEYRHGDPGWHGKGLAIDVPAPWSLKRDKQSEREWSSGVRRIVGIS